MIEHLTHKALVFGLREYVTNAGFKKVVLGLSGGADSAMVAVLAVEALGKENVHAILMPSRFTSKDSIQDAKELAYNLGISLETINIDKFCEIFTKTLGLTGLATENIQARIRGNILMARSNQGMAVGVLQNKALCAVLIRSPFYVVASRIEQTKQSIMRSINKIAILRYHSRNGPCKTNFKNADLAQVFGNLAENAEQLMLRTLLLITKATRPATQNSLYTCFTRICRLKQKQKSNVPVTAAIVLTTGNKSEVATGYCTIYGDMCGGYNPIKDLYKTEVFKMMRYVNTQAKLSEKTDNDTFNSCHSTKTQSTYWQSSLRFSKRLMNGIVRTRMTERTNDCLSRPSGRSSLLSMFCCELLARTNNHVLNANPHNTKAQPVTQKSSRNIMPAESNNGTANKFSHSGRLPLIFTRIIDNIDKVLRRVKGVFRRRPIGHFKGGGLIPESIITKAPSAELRPDQKDSDSLPPYPVLDAILYEMIENHKMPNEISNHPKETVDKIWRLLQTSEHKRRQSAPGTKISKQSFEPSEWRQNL